MNPETAIEDLTMDADLSDLWALEQFFLLMNLILEPEEQRNER
jgi:hypothetical protein